MPTPKKANPKNKGGPKFQWIVTPEIIKEIEILAGRGLTQEEISNYYGISTDTWYGRKKQHPEMGEALTRGKPKAKAFVVGKLFDAIKEGNVSAMIFYLKTQWRWSEHSSLEVTENKAPPPALSITVNDPIEASKIYQSIMGS